MQLRKLITYMLKQGQKQDKIKCSLAFFSFFVRAIGKSALLLFWGSAIDLIVGLAIDSTISMMGDVGGGLLR